MCSKVIFIECPPSNSVTYRRMNTEQSTFVVVEEAFKPWWRYACQEWMVYSIISTVTFCHFFEVKFFSSIIWPSLFSKNEGFMSSVKYDAFSKKYGVTWYWRSLFAQDTSRAIGNHVSLLYRFSEFIIIIQQKTFWKSFGIKTLCLADCFLRPIFNMTIFLICNRQAEFFLSTWFSILLKIRAYHWNYL